MPAPLIALAAIVGLAAMVRCQHLGQLSYSFDEAFCWKMTTFGPEEIWRRAALDNHPPLYFYLLWAWSRAFGDSAAAQRSLNVVFGLAAVVGAYFLVSQVSKRGTPPSQGHMRVPNDLPALAAAALIALSPIQIDFSQHARMGYALGAALSIASCWLLLRALDRSPARWRNFVWYVLSAAALAYTHHYALFIVGAQFLYAVGWWFMHYSPAIARPSDSSRWASASTLFLTFSLVALLYLPWAPSLITQCARVSQIFNTRPFTWDQLAKACYQTLSAYWEGPPPSATVAWWAAAACLVPALAMLAWGRGGLRLLGLGILTTFDGALCASIGDRNIVQARYFVFANALLLCGLPALIVQFGRPSAGRAWVVARGAALVCLTGAVGWMCLLHCQWRDVYAQRPGMRAAVAYLAEARRPGEPVLVCNPMLQITAARHAELNSPRLASEFRVTHPQVLSENAAFPHFQGIAVMRGDDFLSPGALASSGAHRLWAVDSVEWIVPELRLALPPDWIEVSQASFPEWAVYENCRIVVRCYEKGGRHGSITRQVAEVENNER